MLKVVHDEAEPNEASGSVLDEIVREAARQMLAVALHPVEKYHAIEGGQQTRGNLAAYVTEIVRKEVED